MNLDDVLNREELSPTGVDEVNAAMDHIASLEAKNARISNILNNLLARIHRDGGHYQNTFGDEKAAERASEIICDLRSENAALKWELSELREASANYMDAVMHMRYSEIEKTLPILRALLKK